MWIRFVGTCYQSRRADCLGLIHAGQSENVHDFLLEALRNAGTGMYSVYFLTVSSRCSFFCFLSVFINVKVIVKQTRPHFKTFFTLPPDETIQHGACMGIGIAGMGSASPESYEAVRTILHSDSANGGEAAGLAIGLIHLGKAPAEVVSETLAYARDTLHEKIVRSSALGGRLLTIFCAFETLLTSKD